MTRPLFNSDTSPAMTARGARRLPLRLIGLFGVLAAALLLLGTQVARNTNVFMQENAHLLNSLFVEQAIGNVSSALRDVEASQRAYIISGMPERLDDYHARVPQVGAALQRLSTLVADAPEQRDAAAALLEITEARRESMAATLVAYQHGGIEAARDSASFLLSRNQDLAVDDIVRQMLARETVDFERRQVRTLASAHMTRRITVLATAACIGALLLKLALILREINRRRGSEARLHASMVDLGHSLDESVRLGETLRRFSELGSMLQGCRSVKEAIDGFEHSLERMLPGCSGSIALITASENLVETAATWGTHAAAAEMLFTPDDCWAIRRGQIHSISGPNDAFACGHLTSNAPGAYLCVPLAAQGEMLGSLTLFGADAVSPAVRSIAETAAEQMSLALANLKLQEILRTQSVRDPLTGLFNRRYLEASFERELLRSGRRNVPLSVLMLDIDHFKRFNDSHGHDAGDTLLAQFGALLARSVRHEDVACRYGGEEFTIILNETNAELAHERAEQILLAVRELTVHHRRETLGPITASIGIATYPKDGISAEELLRRADAALYAAKRAGRDRAMHAGEQLAR